MYCVLLSQIFSCTDEQHWQRWAVVKQLYRIKNCRLLIKEKKDSVSKQEVPVRTSMGRVLRIPGPKTLGDTNSAKRPR